MTFVYLSLSPDSMLSGGLKRKGQELHKLALLRIDVCARKVRSCGHPGQRLPSSGRNRRTQSSV